MCDACMSIKHHAFGFSKRHGCAAGTAIETNINGKFKFTVHKNATLPPKLQDLNFPLLENANEYVVHGYTVNVRPANLLLLPHAIESAFRLTMPSFTAWVSSFRHVCQDLCTSSPFLPPQHSMPTPQHAHSTACCPSHAEIIQHTMQASSAVASAAAAGTQGHSAWRPPAACTCDFVTLLTCSCFPLLQDYLTLDDPTTIYDISSLDMAFTTAYNNTRDFSMRTFNLTEDQAITAITTVMDFAVTQVVDGMLCAHAMCCAQDCLCSPSLRAVSAICCCPKLLALHV